MPNFLNLANSVNPPIKGPICQLISVHSFRLYSVDYKLGCNLSHTHRSWDGYGDIIAVDNVRHDTILLVLEVDHTPWLRGYLGDGKDGFT